MSTAGGTRPPFAKVLVRRTLIGIVLVLVLLIPSLIMVLVTTVVTGHPEAAATWASIPAIAGIAAVAAGGVDLGVRNAIVLALLAPASIVAGASPVSGAALMAIMCLTVGYMSRYGLHRAAIMTPIMLAWPLIDPPSWGDPAVVDRFDTTFLLWMTVIFFVGAIFPVLVGPFLMRKAHLPAPTPHPRSEAIVYTVMITVLASVATYYVLAHPRMYAGAFLIAAILVLAPIGEADTLRPTIIRIIGTLMGSVLVIGLVQTVSSLAVIYLVGLVCGVAAVASKFSPRAWIYYMLMVPTTACLNALALPEVGSLSKQRVVDNVVGGVLVLLASALAIAYSHWEASRGNSTTTAQAATT